MNLKCNVTQCTYNKNNKCIQDEVEINLNCNEYEFAYCNKYKQSLDSMRENYFIRKITDKNISEHNYVIFSTNPFREPDDCFEAVIEDLISEGNKGEVKILIDYLLSRGNSDDVRYVEWIIDCDKQDIKSNCFDGDSFRFYSSPKNSKLRKFSADFYSKHPQLIENSILMSIQQKMILKGLGI